MMQIVLYSDDINLLDYWKQSIKKSCYIVEELDTLYALSSTIIVINYLACKPTCKDLVQKLTEAGNRVLVLHRVPDFNTAKELLKAGAMGYGNALMREHFLLSALNAIEEGLVWLHPEFTSQLILQIDKKKPNLESTLLKLSQREQEVALLLKEGYTYNEIGLKLSVVPRTVKAHAQNIYAKLHVKDRLSLALLLR